MTIFYCRKSGAKPDTLQRSSHANSDLHGITTDNHSPGNSYQETPLHDLSNSKGNGNVNTSDTHDSQQESPERNVSPATDKFPVYALPEKDKKNASKPKSASAATDIPEYALPKKDKKNINTPNSAIQHGIPEYSLPNKGKKSTNTPGSEAGYIDEPEEEYAYSPVLYNPEKKDRQPVMQGANGNEEAGWMENNIYDAKEEYEGLRGKEGWKANSIYNTREDHEGAEETEGWKANTIYDTREDYAGSHETEGWNDNSIYDTREEYEGSHDTEGWNDNSIYTTSYQ